MHRAAQKYAVNRCGAQRDTGHINRAESQLRDRRPKGAIHRSHRSGAQRMKSEIGRPKRHVTYQPRRESMHLAAQKYAVNRCGAQRGTSHINRAESPFRDRPLKATGHILIGKREVRYWPHKASIQRSAAQSDKSQIVQGNQTGSSERARKTTAAIV
jgi:hypothetical protein